MKIRAALRASKPASPNTTPFGLTAAAILLSLLLSACSAGGYSATPAAPAGATPTLEPTLPAVGKVVATTCDPSLVPEAKPATSVRMTAPPSFRLMVPILTYHRILPPDEAGNSLPGLVVSPEAFAAQLSAFRAAGWQTITLGRLADHVAAGTVPPPRTFVITIDDGWADGYTYAAPILQANGFVATFFVIAGRIGWSSILSPAQMRYLIALGSEIGNHTMDHTALASQGNSRVDYEISSASATIAAATGVWPSTFAYPRGSWNVQTMAAVEACAGMKMAVITDGATLETWPTRFATPRINVRPDRSTADLLHEMGFPVPAQGRAAAPSAAEAFERPAARVGPADAGAPQIGRRP